MDNGKGALRRDPLGHFSRRAPGYDRSSRWVGDKALIMKIRELAEAGSEDAVLDIATGTGKIGQAFSGRVKFVVGVDICPDMTRRARGHLDRIVLTPAERLPFKDSVFDVCVCRQGMQFMKISSALSEIRRVLRPGGRLILCHLTAYGRHDKEDAFLVQRLRNPARKNFFLPGDFRKLLGKSFARVETVEYITRESVNRWISNGAIDENRREKIREAYGNSSRAFRKAHGIEFKDGDILDSMKMVIVKARKKGKNG